MTRNSDQDNTITSRAQSAIANLYNQSLDTLEVFPVGGGYSLNRRSLVHINDDWLFAKEVDISVLDSSGEEELKWLEKDFYLIQGLKKIYPELVPDRCELLMEGHLLILSAYRAEDGWLWAPPREEAILVNYIQAVVDTVKRLEVVEFDTKTIEKLKLQPVLRDQLALDDGIKTIIEDRGSRDLLLEKYQTLNRESKVNKQRYDDMITLLNSPSSLKDIAIHASQLQNQPNNAFGHCDVRSDNLAFQPENNLVKFVDWNWASFTPKGFGATEFLVDMARRGIDISPWKGELNKDMLAAVVGFYLKRSLRTPLALGNSLRDMQTESAAVALELYQQLSD